MRVTTPAHPAHLNAAKPLLADMSFVRASAIPGRYSPSDISRHVSSGSFIAFDLIHGDTAIEILDSSARLGLRPSLAPRLRPSPSKSAMTPSYQFSLGRAPDRNAVVVNGDVVSRRHIILTMFEDLVEIDNHSSVNGVFIGNALLAPRTTVRIIPDAPIIVGIASPDRDAKGRLLICPLAHPWSGLVKAGIDGRTKDGGPHASAGCRHGYCHPRPVRSRTPSSGRARPWARSCWARTN